MWKKIALGVGAVLFVGAGCAAKAPEPTDTKPGTTVSEETTKPAFSPGQSFKLLEEDDWNKAKAESGIASLGADQIIDYGVVADPGNPDTVYFATRIPGEKNSNFISIYKYDKKKLTFERLYKRSFAEGSFPGLPEVGVTMNIIGYDNGRLVIVVHDLDEFPVCMSRLRTGDRETSGVLVSMSLEKPYDGFPAYKPSAEVLNDAKKAEDACRAQFSGE